MSIASIGRIGRSGGLSLGLWLGGLVLLAGCGDTDNAVPSHPTVPVKGVVKLADGKPLGSGSVFFVPTKDAVSEPNGKIGPDGSFVLKTNGQDGAPAGEYKVRIEAASESLPQVGASGRGGAKGAARLEFPVKYTDETTSGLTATVKAEGDNQFTFDLKNTPIRGASQREGRD